MSICLLTFTANLSAQEATLKETWDFISRKMSNYTLFYGHSEYSYDCSSRCSRLQLIGQLNYSTTEILFEGDDCKAKINFSKVQTLELNKKNEIVMSSSEEFISYSSKTLGSFYTADNPRVLIIKSITEEDTPRVLKAFQHLFKLLDVKLVEEKF